jgi:predicted nucleotidyltransferase
MPLVPDVALVEARLADLPTAMPELQLLVLLGSVAAGTATATSDVDLGFAGSEACDRDALLFAVASRLRTDRIDLIDLRRAPPLLAFQAARRGRCLFEREPGTFRSFQSLAYRRYCDTAKLRLATRRRLHRFLEKEGLR